jgi:pimeloyl-ACP methyl ester carboxylesterase
VSFRKAVLVHGVGIGPWSFDALAADLEADHEVVVVHRAGYGTNAAGPAASFDEQVEDLLGRAGGPAAFVGVSGGATLVLALALAHPEAVTAAVVHEPLVGPLAPELHAQVGLAAERLATSGVTNFMRALVGPAAWAALTPEQVADVALRDAVVRAEVPHFLAFAPTSAQLAGLGARLVSSVGGESSRIRHAAAAAVGFHTGTSPLVLPGVGHLAQIEDPAALASALRRLEGGAGGHEQVLAARDGHELKPDR